MIELKLINSKARWIRRIPAGIINAISRKGFLKVKFLTCENSFCSKIELDLRQIFLERKNDFWKNRSQTQEGGPMEKELKKRFEFFLKEKDAGFSGWDFSYLTQTRRKQEFPLSWNYFNEVRRYSREANSLLDMATGGGEFLARLEPRPQKTEATEGYPPNIDVAQKRLEPLQIRVHPTEDEFTLPVKNESFELIINRHASFAASELNRVLTSGGHFITQQVGGLNDLELNLLLQAPESEFSGWNLEAAVDLLKSAGLNIIKSKEDITKTRFYDLGAIIYYLQAVPWQVPDFSVEKYEEELYTLHEFLETQGFMDVTCHRFFLIAKKD